jgi:hypothetical protein
MPKFLGVCPIHKDYLEENGICIFCQHSGIKAIKCTIKELDHTVADMINKGYKLDTQLSHVILIFEDKQEEIT